MGNPIQKDGASIRGDQAALAYFQKEAIATFSDTGSCIDISSNASTVLKIRKSGLLRRGFLKSLAAREQKKFLEFLSDQPRKKTLRLHFERQWLELSFIREADEGLCVLIQNVTEQVQQADALRKASLEAELAQRGQSEFFAHISHELRTPLNAIMGFSDMMYHEVFGEIDNPKYRDYLEILRKSSHQLLDKINDLLEISSLCAGMDTLNEKIFSLDELVKTTLQVHARDYFRQHVQVDIQLLPCSLLADRLKLQQALTHLLHNALKFSPEEGIIRIHAFALPDGGLAISVSDEGSGFGERQLAYLNEINESFSFHDRNRRLLGFGLPLARELVYLHGGNLLFRNTEEGGAEVTIILPRERVIGVRKQAAKTQRSRHSRQPIMESYA